MSRMEEMEGRPGEGGLIDSNEAYLQEYLASLKAEEESELTSWLYRVTEIASAMLEGDFLLSDLIAEGNLGLAEAMLDKNADEEAILSSIRRQILTYMEETDEARAADEKLADTVEALSETIDRLLAETGDKPTIDELANAMGITQDRIIDILKLTGDEPKDDTDE